MSTEAISDPLLELIERLNSVLAMTSSYLGGGTALALQLGHRRSEDQEPDPLMIWDHSRDNIKQGFRDEVRQIAHKIQAG